MTAVGWFGLAAIVLLALLNGLQFQHARTRSRQMGEISRTLHRIADEQSSERVRLISGDRSVRALLVAVNRILDNNDNNKARFQQKEMAIRKMLANISHDLKTPLTVVLGYVESMLHHPRPEESLGGADARIHKLKAKTAEILSLIHQFFDLARLEAGDHELNIRAVNLNELCRERMLSFYDWIQTEKLQVEIDIPDQPLRIQADPEACERILDNLIANAIHHGKDGKTVGLRLMSDEHNARIVVWDKGRGIPETDLNKIFERSYTLDDSRTKLHSGSGLGLTICKRLAEKMGGRIHVESRPFVYTEFTVTFPMLADRKNFLRNA